MSEGMWTVKDAAQEWGLSENRIREYLRAGRITGAVQKIEGRNVVWYFPPQDAPKKRAAGRPKA